MISPMFSILLIPFLAAMFMAINMGGSGTAPSFSAAYGSDIIRKDLIPGIFGLFVFAGAILAGKKVVLTIGKGIIPADTMTFALTTIILFAIAISLLAANLLGVPQSTSQSTIFALMGPAVYFKILKTDKLFFEIIPTWFITPIAAFVISLIIGLIIYRFPRESVRITFQELAHHRIFSFIVIAASCYVAFAIGSNNVANAAGPLTSMVLTELDICASGDKFLIVMILTTLIIAPCFGIGSSLFGIRVTETTGKEIVTIGPLGATVISMVTASLLLIASISKGIPTSLVQMNAAAIIGLGMSKEGAKKILLRTSLRKIFLLWIISPLLAFTLSLALTVIASYLGYVNL